MENKPKLIYKSVRTNLPTEFPAFFYGLPDQHVYVVYARPRKMPSGSIHYEYFVAVLEDFMFDYEEELLLHQESGVKKPLYLDSFVDEYNPKQKVIKQVESPNNIFISDLLVESLLHAVINQIPLSFL